VTNAPPRPNSDLRTPSRLRRELLELHTWAGSPGARRLTTTAAGLDLSLARSTTQDLISGARVSGLPTREFVRAFAMACLTHGEAADPEAEAEHWDQAWLTVVKAHGQLPPTPRTETPRPRSPHRVIFLAAATVAVLAVAALTVFLTRSSPDPVPPATPAAAGAEIQDVYCAKDGLSAAWQNHHSHLYLGVPAATEAVSTFAVTRHRSAAVEGCAHRLTSEELCLEPSSDEVVRAECTDHPGQLWVIENHWYNEGVMWQRLRPAEQLDLCLQQQSAEEGTAIRTVLKPCGTNWIQQWQLQPA
jgi:hypothetical protein